MNLYSVTVHGRPTFYVEARTLLGASQRGREILGFYVHPTWDVAYMGPTPSRADQMSAEVRGEIDVVPGRSMS